MIPAAFAAALEAMDQRLDADSTAPLAVALSGGGDSLALLRIVKAWATAVRRPVEALTVDHGLHPDSAAWTHGAGEAAAALDTPWRALAWTGPKPASGLPAAARSARHALLAEATRATGASVLLLGHTADDVVESDMIRADTPTHGHLAEWSPSPAWPEGRDVFLLRPLLTLRRVDLQTWLRSEGVSWLDDPANSDLRFARSRARASLAHGSGDLPAPPVHTPPPSLGLSRHPDVPLTGRWRVAGVLGGARPASDDTPGDDDGQKDDAAEALANHGVLDLALATLWDAERPVDVLAKALLCVSGRSRPPTGGALARLLVRLSEARPFTATLSGARLRVEGGRLRLTRELGRSPPQAVPLAPAVVQVFDGRFEVVAHAAGWHVAPLAGHAAGLPKNEREALRSAPAEARPSLPVLIGPGGETRLPKPLGAGPAVMRCRVGERLAAAWGLVSCEEALEQAWGCSTPVAPRAQPSYLER